MIEGENTWQRGKKFGDWNDNTWRERSTIANQDRPEAMDAIRITKHKEGNVWLSLRDSAGDEFELYIDETAQAWLVQEILFGEVGDNG